MTANQLLQTKYPTDGLDQLCEKGLIKLGRGNVISKKDIAAIPGFHPIYSSAKENEGKFGEYGQFMFDEEMLTWSVDGGGRFFHRKKHKFSVTNVGGTLRITDPTLLNYRFLYFMITYLHGMIPFDWVLKAHPSVIRKLYTHIPIPPLDEQLRIVAMLDEAFAGIATAIANAQKNLTNARALFKDAAQEAFRKSAITKRWSECTVAAAAADQRGAIRTGPFGSQLLHSEFTDKGVAVLGIDNAVANDFRWDRLRFISPLKYKALERYRVYPGDVIITIMGTCGRCAVIPDDIPIAINTKHLCCITVDKKKCLPQFLHSYFLYHPIAQEYLGRTAKGSIMAGLNMGLIKEMPLFLPTIAEQERLIAKLFELKRTTNKLVGNFELKLADLTELKQSLLQKAFAGELT